MLEGLIVFLTEGAKGAGISGPPGDVCSKVARTCTHLMNTATYELWKASCNDPTIGSYNNYHLSPKGIPSGNQRCYGLVNKWLINLERSLENCRVALGTILGRVTFWENIHIGSRELWECYTDLRDDFCCRIDHLRIG